MNRMLSLVSLAVLALSTGCASSTVIRSTPPGAIVKNIRGEKLGKTPFSYSGGGIINSTETFTLEKEGYEATEVKIRRDQWNGWAIAGWAAPGALLTIAGAWPLGLGLLTGILWSADYPQLYDVDLEPAKVITPPLAAEESDELDAPVAPRARVHGRTVAGR